MFSHLNALDILLLAIVGISIVFGIIKGLIRELLSLVFFVLGVILAFLFYQDVGSVYLKYFNNKDVAHFAGFITIFVVMLIIGALVTYFVKKVLVVGPMKPIDRILGGVFGLLRGILVTGVIVFGLIAFPVNKKWISESQLSPHVITTMNVVYKLLPEKYKEKIDIIKTEKNDRKKNSGTG